MMRSTLLLLVLTCNGCLLVHSQSDLQSCYNAEGLATRCEPPRSSFSFQKQPFASSTCGSPPSQFCSRSASLGRIRSDCSGICDSNDSANAHPPEFMTDFVLFNTRWQSENSLEPQNMVTVDIPLGTMVEVNVVSFIFESLIPANFRILKSVDYGQTYTNFHYFSTNCIRDYSIPDEQILTLENETAVLCQAVNIPPFPGQISFLPLLGRPSANDSTPGFSRSLYSFLTATDIRVVLATHYVIPDLSPDDFGYYYALKDLNVLGSCQCNGHAADCRVDPSTGNYSCVCQHNTTGNFCERCSDSYQDVPWEKATGSTTFECIACDCNGHSEQCQFDPVLYEQSNRTSGGVCRNCRNNRAGRRCERCADLFYPVAETDTSFSCVACDCNLAGVRDNGDCANLNESLSLGECNCKQNTEGRTCGTCRPGFFNLSMENEVGCQDCGCNPNGTLNSSCDTTTGVCRCKPNIAGDKCDRCRSGFYQPDPFSTEGCLPCNCNLGGSTSSQCDSRTGICLCRQGIQGTTCSEVQDNYFFRSVDYLILEGENVTGMQNSNPVIVTDMQNTLFTGTGFYGFEETVDLANFGSLTPPVTGFYEVVFRYNLAGTVVWNSTTLMIMPSDESSSESSSCGDTPAISDLINVEYTDWMTGVGLSIHQRLCLQGGRSYNFVLTNFNSGRNNSSAVLNIDSLVLMPVDAPRLAVFMDPMISRDYRECIGYYRSLATQSSAPASCVQTIFTVSTEVYNGAAACDCDVVGTVMGTSCAAFGGQCSCLPGVRGRQCDTCSPGFYNLTSSGCTTCSCNFSGSAVSLCDAVDGSCMCIENVGGRDCSSCIPGYWGFNNPTGCIRCNCNPTGSMMTQCDEDTGVCLCKQGVMGESCDRCQNNTFGFSLDGCSNCSCDPVGSNSITCDVNTGECSCLPTTIGRNCSMCMEGTFNLQPTNPNGCQPCFCSGLSNVCSSAPGFIYGILSTMFNGSDSSPLRDWRLLNITSNAIPFPINVAPPTMGEGGVTLEITTGVYLEAPNQFIGNQLRSYAQYIRVELEPIISGAAVESTLEYSVILSSNDMTIGTNFTRSGSGFRVLLHESSGWVHTDTLSALTAQEFQRILSSLTRLLISASYDMDVTLSSIGLDTAIQRIEITDPLSLMEVTSVEDCECPMNYTGLSCEQCSPGFTRTPFGTCELCQCNGRSIDCNSVTGECLNCSNSTAGRSCDICRNGTFGDPSRDIECLPCPCPLTSGAGQFTDECVLLSSGNVSCLNCPVGHTGEQCESCLNGYFGDPLGVFGPPTGCSDCGCSGNIDVTDPDSCNRVTGICMRCLNDTAGAQCERCMDGFYGDAITAKNCLACDCNVNGSINSTCDHLTGQCRCLANIAGRQCNQCQPGFYGLETASGCMPCNCHPLGSASNECDEAGQCQCLPGVTGQLCDQCRSGFFGLSRTGCRACSCSSTNSESVLCDMSDGTCLCRPGSTGSMCQECLQNYFQADDGRCTSCPECYQDLEDLYNISLLNFTTSESQFMNLTSDAISLEPFDDRVMQYQRDIMNLSREASELLTRQNDLLLVYNTTLISINETLRNDFVQANLSVESLKRRFTTIYIIAFTTQELMNNTLLEYTMAIDLVTRIEQVDLYILRNLSNTVQSLSMEVNTTANNTATTLRNLLAQVEDLRNLTYEILSISSSLLGNASTLMSIQQGIMNDIEPIMTICTSIDAQITQLEINVTAFETELMMIPNNLRMKYSSLVEVPDPNTVISLTGNATEMVDFARTNILSEISSQNMRFATLNRTYINSRAQFETLFQQVSSIGTETNRLLMVAINASRVANATSNDIQDLFRRAEMVARELEDFNNETFQVGERVAAAMRDIDRLNSNATTALAEAQRLEDSLRNSSTDIRRAKDVALAASNISNASSQVISSVDTRSIVTSINSSLQGTVNAMETTNQLSNNATQIRNNVAALHDDITRSSGAVASADILNDQSALNRTIAVSAINELRQTFNNLDQVDQATLEGVRQLVMDVRGMYNAANLEVTYQELNSRLMEQRAMREQLQRELNGLRDDIEHLRRVNQALPSECNQN